MGGERGLAKTRVWHGGLAALVLLALVAQTVITVGDGRSAVNLFSYFTVQANLLVLAGSALIAVRPERDGRGWSVLWIAGLAGISVTGVVYATVLRGIVDLSGPEWGLDKVFHYVCPAAYVAGWLLFAPRTRFVARDAAWFLVWPLAWLAYTLVRGVVAQPVFNELDLAARSHYPYPFLDLDEYGYGQVALNAVAVTVLMVAVSAAYVVVSRRITRETVRR